MADGFKAGGVTLPSGLIQSKLLEEVYKGAGVRPQAVSYIECHGTGTKVGDPEELHAITRVLCPFDRKSPLLIGSVKSNMGHAEPAAGLCGVAKVILAMQRGSLPGNLHYSNPNPLIPGLMDGRLKVVTETRLTAKVRSPVNMQTEWREDYSHCEAKYFWLKRDRATD